MEQEWMKPAFLLTVPALYVLGLFLKQARSVADRHIPLLLGACGGALGVGAALAALGPQTVQQWMNAIGGGLALGILSAGAAVYGNQIFKQAGKDPLSPEEYMQTPGGRAQ